MPSPDPKLVSNWYKTSPEGAEEPTNSSESRGVHKSFMFYGGYGLHGQAGQDEQRRFLMIGPEDTYDLAHFEFILRAAGRIQREHSALAEHVSVSLHCELADILNAYTRLVARDATLTGLRVYSAARPPHSEGLAVWIAVYLASEAACRNVNLLHLSSRKALEAALTMAGVFTQIDFRREVTVGHLLLDVDAPTGAYGKVNPPIRPREDVEFLWRAVLDGKVDWIVSDHACCAEEIKGAGPGGGGDVWLGKSGFGGTEYLLAGVFSEGSKRGLPYHRMAELLALNPARRYGLLDKGDIDIGYDADLALLDPDRHFVVRAAESPSAQGYSPFEGQELTGRVTATFLRGALAWEDGKVVGGPRGRFLARPCGARRPA
jgi:allantoinase